MKIKNNKRKAAIKLASTVINIFLGLLVFSGGCAKSKT
jgi:hypothetical protein